MLLLVCCKYGASLEHGLTIGKLYGKNYREINNDALDKPFNAWVKGKQFILGEELTSGDRRAIMTRLKGLVTGATIALDE